jgi:predicted NUDIX family NTP pyrophosphohydrolase
MSLHSGGILLFRFKNNNLEVMLVHPGGPFWERKDEGAWSIPKGLFEENESPLNAAKREFREETGFEVEGEFIGLGELRLPSRKMVHAWALEKDLDETKVASNAFSLEWPKKSGIIRQYPEIDRAGWFDIDQAKRKIQKGQAGFLNRLMEAIDYAPKKEGDQGQNEEKWHGLKEDQQDLEVRTRHLSEELKSKDGKGRKDSSSQRSLTGWLRD